jgi:hypothetical protein
MGIQLFNEVNTMTLIVFLQILIYGTYMYILFSMAVGIFDHNSRATLEGLENFTAERKGVQE